MACSPCGVRVELPRPGCLACPFWDFGVSLRRFIDRADEANRDVIK